MKVYLAGMIHHVCSFAYLCYATSGTSNQKKHYIMNETYKYAVGYFGTSLTAYCVRADVARKIGVALYWIESTSASLKLLKEKGWLHARFWNGQSMITDISIITTPTSLVCYDKSNANKKCVRKKIIKTLLEKEICFVTDPSLR